jgi:hypothetical protein
MHAGEGVMRMRLLLALKGIIACQQLAPGKVQCIAAACQSRQHGIN